MRRGRRLAAPVRGAGATRASSPKSSTMIRDSPRDELADARSRALVLPADRRTPAAHRVPASQASAVARWVTTPMRGQVARAEPRRGERLAHRTLRCTTSISAGSCSSQPGCGKRDVERAPAHARGSRRRRPPRARARPSCRDRARARALPSRRLRDQVAGIEQVVAGRARASARAARRRPSSPISSARQSRRTRPMPWWCAIPPPRGERRVHRALPALAVDRRHAARRRRDARGEGEIQVGARAIAVTRVRASRARTLGHARESDRDDALVERHDAVPGRRHLDRVDDHALLEKLRKLGTSLRCLEPVVDGGARRSRRRPSSAQSFASASDLGRDGARRALVEQDQHARGPSGRRSRKLRLRLARVVEPHHRRPTARAHAARRIGSSPASRLAKWKACDRARLGQRRAARRSPRSRRRACLRCPGRAGAGRDRPRRAASRACAARVPSGSTTSSASTRSSMLP